MGSGWKSSFGEKNLSSAAATCYLNKRDPIMLGWKGKKPNELFWVAEVEKVGGTLSTGVEEKGGGDRVGGLGWVEEGREIVEWRHVG